LKWLGVSCQSCFLQGEDRTCNRFWHDLRCGKMALKCSYPELYSIAHNKNVLVSNYLDPSSSFVHWNSSFIRAVQDWDLESLDSFFNLLYTSKTHSREVNRMLWTSASNHDFEVRSYYKMLQTREHCSFPLKSF
jgi:hypothetical protein